ncbi:hypothetical protein L1987_50839 [Smallanthus sonchifolius]|uniref:Uncharacterized protein n=1 Tax=Smallanthus sonchifolius TaxID=185202 RepID=A0ACB9ENK0_9ASTR|nr:hypothetical protein L1987_50839 [Smallanthus sonchifolius]
MAAAVKRSQPKRGQNQIKIKIFKIIAKSLKDLAIGLAGKPTKAAGDGGGSCGCFNSPATVTPLEATGGMKAAAGAVMGIVRYSVQVGCA